MARQVKREQNAIRDELSALLDEQKGKLASLDARRRIAQAVGLLFGGAEFQQR